MNLSFLTLPKNEHKVEPGFRPHDMGVQVEFSGSFYHPEWRLVSELQYSFDHDGPPEYWCTDGHRIYFDKAARSDMRVICADYALSENKP